MKNVKEKLSDMGIKSINYNILGKRVTQGENRENMEKETLKEATENFKRWNKETYSMMSLPTQCYLS